MATLYLRHVPDDVARQLATLAEREGVSLTAWAVRELTESARRADNLQLLAGLPDTEVADADIVAAVGDGRGQADLSTVGD